MEENFTIKVSIAERYYPLKVERTDEARILNAAKRINDSILQYRKLYTDKDTQDFLAMVALQFVAKLEQYEESKVDNYVIEILEKMNHDLQVIIDKE